MTIRKPRTTPKPRTPPSQPTTALSVPEAAAVLGLAMPTLRRLIRQREIPHARIGARVVLLDTDVQAFLRAHRIPAREGAMAGA